MDTIDIPVSDDDGGPHGYETIECLKWLLFAVMVVIATSIFLLVYERH